MKHKAGYIVLGIFLLILVGVLLFIFSKHPSTNKKVALNTCATKQFSMGSSGNCVYDIQTMIDFMETDGLNQCPFTGSSILSINGSYDTNTQDQVKVVQTWLNCYNKQEGQPIVDTANGIVGTSTWSGLCTYAYQYPSQANQSSSQYLKASIAAGKNAGC